MDIVTENKDIVCSVCCVTSSHTVVKSVKAGGVPDIDMRPNDAYRHAMKYWVMECPICGYCNGTIDIKFNSDREFLESDEYRKLDGIKSKNTIASRLIKRAMVSKKNGNPADAAQSYLYAAWVFDDDENGELASECRKRAAEILDENGEIFRNDDNMQLLKADMLRRSGQFERVEKEYANRKFKSPLMQAISGFEVELAKKQDSAAHRADEIPGVKAK